MTGFGSSCAVKSKALGSTKRNSPTGIAIWTRVNFRVGDLFVKRLFLEWKLQNEAGYPVVFTKCSILNRGGPDVDKNRSPFVRPSHERIELHPF